MSYMQNHLMLETPKALTTKYLLKNKYGDDYNIDGENVKDLNFYIQNGQSADENLTSL